MSPNWPKAGVVSALMWVTAVAAATGAQQAGNSVAKKPKNPVKSTPESVTAGRQIYEQKCSFCHGTEGKGAATGSPPSLSDAKWDHGSSDGEVFLSIRDGIGPAFRMVPYKDKIPDRDIWHIVNYLRSLRAKRK
jgi:mono/diheme cytochrome c family protein